MTCTLKIATHAPNDFYVLGDYPFGVGAASYGINNKVNFIVHKGGSIVASGYPKLATDRSLRIPADLYTFRFRNITPGTYTVQATATSDSGSLVSDSVSIRVFQSPTVVISVANQSQFTAALNTAKTSPADHVKIVVDSGDYLWDVDVTARDGLVSVEAARGASVVMRSDFGSSYPVNWVYWYGVTFLPSVPAVCYSVTSTSRCVFERCQISGAATGLLCDAGSGVRLEECHFANVIDAVVNASVARSTTWENVTGVVFSNCKVIDGVFGSRVTPLESQDVASSSLRVVKFSSVSSGILVRSVSSVGDYGKLLDMSSGSYSNFAFVGNSISSTDGGGLVAIGGVNNAVISDNTIRSTSSDKTSSVTISGSMKNCIVQNNWFSKVDRSASHFAGQTFEANFIGEAATDVLPVSFTVASDPFENNFMFPRQASPLRFSASSVDIGVRTIQGLAKERQVGALPYRSPSDIASAYQAMRVNPQFSYVGPSIESI